jgi:hypothetical protein
MAAYVVTVQIRPHVPEGFADSQIDTIGDLLVEHGGSFLGDSRGGWEMTFSIDAIDGQVAAGLALEIAHQICTAAALPVGDVVRLSAIRDDVEAAQLGMPGYPDLVSGTEAAKILGVSRQRLHQLASEHSQFPAPLYRLAVGSLWARASVKKFADEWERRPGRPRRRENLASIDIARSTDGYRLRFEAKDGTITISDEAYPTKQAAIDASKAVGRRAS